ncbi:hypothetical protein JOH50_001753 [Rhizobium leguminosarum]|nr:hypothetical protein [Rhizobium leguminosarum]
MSRLLDAYRKDCKAGELGQDDDALTFTYDNDYLPTAPVMLSVFLPKQDEPLRSCRKTARSWKRYRRTALGSTSSKHLSASIPAGQRKYAGVAHKAGYKGSATWGGHRFGGCRLRRRIAFIVVRRCCRRLVTNSSQGAVEDGRLLVSRRVVGFRQIRTVRSTASKWDQAQAHRRQLQDPAYT